MKEQKVRVFISYSHQNREICDTIAAFLERDEHFDVWYDKGLVPGEVYRKKIVDVIRNTDYFIVLLSGASVRSEWVLDEVEYAKKIRKRILPVWIEDVDVPDDLDMILQRYHSLFWHLRSSDAQFRQSLMSILDNGREREQELTLSGFGNEFSEAVNARMKDLLEKERQEAYAECYLPENACLLGMAYLFGGTGAENRNKARHYFRAAEYFGSRDGTFYLLQMQLDDRQMETWDEPDEAFCAPIVKRIIELAEAGSVPAKMFMGNLYWYGRYGCPKDMEKSAAMYETCARMGDARAQYMMASNYCHGEGVPRDYELAKMYANLAVEQKYLKAWRRWGEFYRDGLAVQQDYQRARACYERGAQMGDCNCYNEIGDMLYFGQGFPVDYEAAFGYYLKGETAPEDGQKYGLGKAKRALGRCYELGHGVERDLAIAAEKYLAGYRCGRLDCREAYLRCSSQLKAQAESE